MLRTVLAAYLEADPRELRFNYSEHRKPALAGFGLKTETDLQFNLSHTQGAVLLGICRQRAIGVDVERVRQDLIPRDIAARFFSTAEQRALFSLPEAEQREAFFRCWTRKEAFLKARGHGLSFPLAGFDVSIGAGESEARLTTRPDPSEAQNWQILPVPAPEGCAAAVAVARGASQGVHRTTRSNPTATTPPAATSVTKRMVTGWSAGHQSGRRLMTIGGMEGRLRIAAGKAMMQNRISRFRVGAMADLWATCKPKGLDCFSGNLAWQSHHFVRHAPSSAGSRFWPFCRSVFVGTAGSVCWLGRYFALGPRRASLGTFVGLRRGEAGCAS
jgi:phosphopantetheinyl transferase